MARPAPAQPRVRARVVALRCDRCEVTWRGTLDEPCWLCGHAGTPGSATTPTS